VGESVGHGQAEGVSGVQVVSVESGTDEGRKEGEVNMPQQRRNGGVKNEQ